ncbi:MAG TPA: hypothetical protein VFE03_02890 [Caulobacteraceae bacterium]|jgi:hypothetical protein|nr:hypothetical protein [Caulobacteraceae bacterium]
MESLKDRILKDRRVMLAAGGGLALVAGLALAMLISSSGRKAPSAPPASQAGLIVQTGRDDDIKLDPKRPLRCFVGGQFVGEVPLEECAKQNGVATGALDVGLDPSGALAAAGGETTEITPLPPQPVTSANATQTVANPAAAQTAPESHAVSAAMAGDCWRYGGGSWARISQDMSLNACVQALYAGRCEKAAAYGRWIDQTLRLTAGRIEISSDNRNFRPLVEQGPGCSAPAVG